jgi:hypothetical protein
MIIDLPNFYQILAAIQENANLTTISFRGTSVLNLTESELKLYRSRKFITGNELS